MYDRDIRQALKRFVTSQHPATLTLDELPLCRRGRADVAAINSAMWGFEIKSEHDSLNRLASQIPSYDLIFDYSTVVAAACHLEKVRHSVPPHWGIWVPKNSADGIQFKQIRKPKRNGNISLEAIARLVWKREAVAILRCQGREIRADAQVQLIWNQLCQLNMSVLSQSIRDALKVRRGSEADSTRMLNDGSSPTEPIPSHHQIRDLELQLRL